MPIPHYSELFSALLEDISGSDLRKSEDTREALSRRFGLSKEERERPSPGRQPQPRFTNMVANAKARLKMAGLIERVRPGVYRITDSGRRVLHEGPFPITEDFLRRFPDYRFGR
jgi:restriction system protein